MGHCWMCVGRLLAQAIPENKLFLSKNVNLPESLGMLWDKHCDVIYSALLGD